MGHHTFSVHFAHFLFCEQNTVIGSSRKAIHKEKKVQQVQLGLERLKGTEHQVKIPKTMKDLQRDNVSHISVKEKTSKKELKLQQRRFRAEVRKGLV